MSNIKEFKKLIDVYKSITIDKIKSTKKNKDWAFFGAAKMSNLTGFGENTTCPLCKAVFDCSECIYVIKTDDSCDDCNNRESFTKIKWSKNSKQLYDAIQQRIKRMEYILTLPDYDN
jgi:hypothetical protein